MCQSEIALYYPYIDITKPMLIKTAALYWDKIQTIVPRSMTNPFKRACSREAYNENFLQERYVDPYDEAVESAGLEFFQDIDNESIQKHLTKGLRPFNCYGSGANIQRMELPTHLEKFSPIFMDKISNMLRRELELSSKDEYFLLPKRVGYAYMSRLASAISAVDNVAPLTIDPLYNDIMVDRIVDYSGKLIENQSKLATLSLQSIAIDSSVPLIKILRFRDQNRKMLLSFRRQIRKISRQVQTGLNTAKSQAVFEAIIKDEILPMKDEVESKLQENDLKFLASCTTITLAGCASLAFSPEYLGQLVGSGILLCAALIGNLRSERTIPASSPLGYLYKAQTRFAHRA